MNCIDIDEQSVVTLAETCNRIVDFRASGCIDAITDISLIDLVKNSKTVFEVLDISY